jgi:hypothetical protein
MARTTAELRALVKQYLARQSGTKPDKSPVTSGFLTGKSVKKSDLSAKELEVRDRIKARLKTLRQNTDVQTDRQVMRARLSQNQGNPSIPTTPRPRPTQNQGPFPGAPGTTPPTKPLPSRATVSAVQQRLRARRANNKTS